MSRASWRAAVAVALAVASPLPAQVALGGGAALPVGATETPASWGAVKDLATWRAKVRPSYADSLRLAAAQADSLRQLAPMPGLPQTGKPDAPVVVEVFGDYQCPYCARQEQLAGRALAEYERRGLVRTVYYDFPIPGHRNAWDAAVFSLCLRQQSAAAWSAGRAQLYERQAAWGEAADPRPAFAAVARSAQANATAALTCYEAGDPLPVAQFGMSQALARQIRATPTYVVAGQPVRGGAPSAAAFAQILDTALLGTGAPTSTAPSWKARVGATP